MKNKALIILILIVATALFLYFSFFKKQNLKVNINGNVQQTSQIIDNSYENLFKSAEQAEKDNDKSKTDFYLAEYLAKSYKEEKIDNSLNKLLPLLNNKVYTPVSFISGKLNENFLSWFVDETYAMWNVQEEAIDKSNYSFIIAEAKKDDYLVSVIATPYIEGWTVIGGNNERNEALILGDAPRVLFKNKKSQNSKQFLINLNTDNRLQYIWQPEFYDFDKDGIPEVSIRYNLAWADGFSQELSIYKIKDDGLVLMKQFSGKAEGIARKLTSGDIEVGEGAGKEGEGHLAYSNFRLTTWEFKQGQFVKKSEKTVPHILLDDNWTKYYEKQ